MPKRNHTPPRAAQLEAIRACARAQPQFLRNSEIAQPERTMVNQSRATRGTERLRTVPVPKSTRPPLLKLAGKSLTPSKQSTVMMIPRWKELFFQLTISSAKALIRRMAMLCIRRQPNAAGRSLGERAARVHPQAAGVPQQRTLPPVVRCTQEVKVVYPDPTTCKTKFYSDWRHANKIIL